MPRGPIISLLLALACIGAAPAVSATAARKPAAVHERAAVHKRATAHTRPAKRRCRTSGSRHHRTCTATKASNRARRREAPAPPAHPRTTAAKPPTAPVVSTAPPSAPILTAPAPVAAPLHVTAAPAGGGSTTPPPSAPPVQQQAPASTPAPPQAPAPGPLRWAPPTLVNPITVTLGAGYTRTALSPTRDYIVKLPGTVKRGGTTLIGGHDVVIEGGAITIPTGTPDDNMHRAAIYVKDATGTVHIEGVHIDDSGGELFDGITIAAPLATVQLENDRIVDMHGGMTSFHADIVQPWGGVGDLRIDHLTGTSDYQGLTLFQDKGPIGRAELSDVDLTALTPATIDGGGHMLWLTTGSTTCTAYPISFSSVFVRPRAGRTMANSVWPQFNTPVACRESGAVTGSWPALPFTGTVQAGAPTGGSYVPTSAVGVGYVSPGYATG